jgi:hypothetical protein
MSDNGPSVWLHQITCSLNKNRRLTQKTPHPVFTVRGPFLGGCTSELALEFAP